MLYEAVYNEALNTKRSSYEQAGGKIVMEALATMKPDEFYTIEELCKLRRSTTRREKDAFYWFFGSFLECVLMIDTPNTSWKVIKKTHEPWVQIGSKRPASMMQKRSGKAEASKNLLRILNQPKPTQPGHLPPIPEDSDDDLEVVDRNQTNDNNSKASSDNKQSALIPKTNVPMNDGTHRVTFV